MILTHCARLKDFGHTSWAEIKSFYEICDNNRLLDNVEMRDYSELSQTAYVSDLTIFAAGSSMHQNIVDLANNCKRLYIVVQDPNWETSLHQIRRNFTLITPFEKLRGKDLSETKSILKKIIPTLKTDYVDRHVCIRFGDMLAYNEDYLRLYTSCMRNSKDSQIKDRAVYIGSLKKDRIKDLSNYILRHRKLDFYGNFDKSDFLKMSGLIETDLEDVRFFGRTDSSYEVPSIYRRYSSVLFSPDDKISELETSYIRFAEMCLSNSKVICTSNRKDVIDKLKSLTDSSGHLSWSKFIEQSMKYNLLSQIKSAYEVE